MSEVVIEPIADSFLFNMLNYISDYVVYAEREYPDRLDNSRLHLQLDSNVASILEIRGWIDIIFKYEFDKTKAELDESERVNKLIYSISGEMKCNKLRDKLDKLRKSYFPIAKSDKYIYLTEFGNNVKDKFDFYRQCFQLPDIDDNELYNILNGFAIGDLVVIPAEITGELIYQKYLKVLDTIPIEERDNRIIRAEEEEVKNIGSFTNEDIEFLESERMKEIQKLQNLLKYNGEWIYGVGITETGKAKLAELSSVNTQ